MTAPKRWSEPLTPDEHGHVVMADGWCNQCEAWHPDAPMSVRHDFPPDPTEGIKALPLGMFVGANRYDTDDESVLHLWTSDGRSFDMRWPKSRSAPVSEQPDERPGQPGENDGDRAGLAGRERYESPLSPLVSEQLKEQQ